MQKGLRRAEIRREEGRLFEKLSTDTAKDEAVILSFIKTELMNLERTSRDDFEKMHDLVDDLLCKKLDEFGGEDTVRLFVQWLSQYDWSPEDNLPLTLAGTIMQISGRIQIDKEQLQPLLESKNKNLAEMAAQMYQCISYDGVPEDIERVINSGVNKKEAFERRAGEIFSWRGLARERGFALNGGDLSETLLRLLLDCDKRIANLEKSREEGKLGAYECGHLKVREGLFGLHAIEELIENDRDKAFEYLVSKMEKDGDGATAAYYLYAMTGNHFPVYGHFTYGRLRLGVDLTRKAAAAWRIWRKTNELRELTGSEQAALSLDKRLADFRLKGKRTDQKEHSRPIDEVISELLSTNDRRIQKMLVEVISCKTLTDEQVQSIIVSAKTSRSESHLITLWQALWVSGSSRARTYLDTVINKNTEEGIVVEFLQPITGIDMRDAAFLTTLYSEHPSALVKDCIIQFASPKFYGRNDEAQMKLIKTIMQISTNDEHKLAVLWSVYPRAGINTRGNSMVTEALKNEDSPALRKAIYEKVIQHSPEKWIGSLLHNQEPEETRLAGLLVFKKAVLGNRIRPRSFDRDILSVLLRIAEHDSSEKVKLVAEEIVDEIRKKEINEFINRQRQMLVQIKSLVEGYKEKGEIDEKIKSQLERMNNPAFLELRTSQAIEGLKIKYGKLPEEDELKSELEIIQNAQNKLIKQVLDSEI